jgi:hypothetical protein
MAHIEIETRGTSVRIVVDGQDISGLVTSYSLNHTAAGVPVLNVSMIGTDLSMKGEGCIQFPEDIKNFLDTWTINHSAVSTDTETTEHCCPVDWYPKNPYENQSEEAISQELNSNSTPESVS